MKINWKIRLKNKGTLTAIVLGMIALVYQILGIVGVTPPVNQSNVAEAAVVLINMLLLAGVVIDPTTKGISDSDMAMMYTCPRCDLESAEDDYEDYDEYVRYDEHRGIYSSEEHNEADERYGEEHERRNLYNGNSDINIAGRDGSNAGIGDEEAGHGI